jgi:tRNA(Ile)-lysidine synthase
MLSAFKEHINSRFPYLKKSTVLIACSGGLDSMTLVHLLTNTGIDFHLAHCNFGLRGAESDNDEAFVRKSAEKLNRKLFVKKFELNQHEGSIQLAARNLRYDWFKELLNEHKFDYILTAHHADDSLETFLINLSRGTGIEGLTGIPEENRSTLRPLLPFSRAQILAYAKDNNILWREDSSNAETKYVRNKIRHKIVPELKELHPTFLNNFSATQKHLEQTNSWVQSQIIYIKQKLFIKEHNNFKINIKKLEKIYLLDVTLYLLFKAYGFTNIKDLRLLLSAESGKELHSKTHRLVKDREHLLLAENRSESQEVYELAEEGIHTPLKLVLKDVAAMEDYSKNTIYVDKETLNYPLVIRKRENGDYFYPLGMNGKKKLSKYFKDEKIDILSKEKQWLLCSDSQIVWVIGRRADDRFKVTQKTKQLVKITWYE